LTAAQDGVTIDKISNTAWRCRIDAYSAKQGFKKVESPGLAAGMFVMPGRNVSVGLRWKK
jgi:hypothetical protein